MANLQFFNTVSKTIGTDYSAESLRPDYRLAESRVGAILINSLFGLRLGDPFQTIQRMRVGADAEVLDLLGQDCPWIIGGYPAQTALVLKAAWGSAFSAVGSILHQRQQPVEIIGSGYLVGTRYSVRSSDLI